MTKTILITGATAGFGRATARRFAQGGWRVIGTGRRAERLRELSEEIGEPSFRSKSTCGTGGGREPRAAVAALGRHRPTAQQCRAGAADRPAARHRLGSDRSGDRDQCHGPRRADSGAAAEARRTAGADHQPVVRRRELSVQGRRGLRGHQGVRPPVLARSSLRPCRHRRSSDLGRAGHGGNGVHARPDGRRPGSIGQALLGHEPDDRRKIMPTSSGGWRTCRRISTSIRSS